MASSPIIFSVLFFFIFSFSSAQPSFRPKALLLPITKDKSTNQYTTVRHRPAHSPRRRLRRLRPRRPKPLGRLRQRLRLLHLPLPSLQLRRVLTRRIHKLRRMLLSSETRLQQQHLRLDPRQHRHRNSHLRRIRNRRRLDSVNQRIQPGPVRSNPRFDIRMRGDVPA
ncbi:unnamed protein product [Brassica oleracea]